MAEVKAFKGLRFNTEKAGKTADLCCPPYDIINEKQRQDFINTNEYNIIRLELPKGENPYETAGKTLSQWEENGILMREDAPALYIYEEEFTSYGKRQSIKGVIADVKLEEFSKGIILPHEYTLSKAKEDRLNLMKATNCNFSQIYALYMDDTHTTQALIEEISTGTPDMQFTDDDNVTHKMWILKDEAAINKICSGFNDRKLYIADGHHRYETALNYRNYCRENKGAKIGDGCDYQMIFLMDMGHPGLVVYPTHRLVRGLSDFNKEVILEKCGKYFEITAEATADNMEAKLDALYKDGKKAFGFYCGGSEWYKLVLKDINCMDTLLKDMSAASRQLDVTVLHTLILENIMGIDKENMANQINLTYTKIFDEAIEGVNNGDFQCAFILNPTRVTEIRDVASSNEKMPQKSTYFYPKTITGMVMNKLD